MRSGSGRGRDTTYPSHEPIDFSAGDSHTSLDATEHTTKPIPRLPTAPHSIQKGSSHARLLDQDPIECLTHNIRPVHPDFGGDTFQRSALNGLKSLSIMQRGQHLAKALREQLPKRYEQAVQILLKSLTPTLTGTEDLGLTAFFYLPHVSFVASYGQTGCDTQR